MLKSEFIKEAFVLLVEVVRRPLKSSFSCSPVSPKFSPETEFSASLTSESGDSGFFLRAIFSRTSIVLFSG